MRNWERLAEGLYRFEDSCMVYALATGKGILVVNPGSGAWLGHSDELPEKVRWCACTHYFRDHSAGAGKVAEAGVEIWAPYWEREQFSDPEGLFSRIETYIIYENKWDLFAPIRGIPVTRWLRDWEELDAGSVSITILPTPGVTLGAVSLLARIGGRKILFGGELIHSPGKLYRVAPLQYGYNNLPGAVNLRYAIGVARRARPDVIAPSTGPRLIEDPLPALDALAANLAAACAPRPMENGPFATAADDALDRITEHVFQSRYSGASSYFVVSESGKVLAVDYGYRNGLGFGGQHFFPRNRRPLLHGVRALEENHGIKGIDAVMVTHFHDDHVAGIPTLQRIYGTRCLAGENFAMILRNPEAFAFPCTWPEPIDVEPVPLERPFRWEEYEFTLYPMSGHTRFSTLIRFEADGEVFTATGDQYFFEGFGDSGESPIMHNHVYRNGAVLGSFRESNEIISRIHPTIILPGHGTSYRVPEGFYAKIEEYSADYERIHAGLMPLGPDDVHAEVDSRLAWLEPYRRRIDTASPLEYAVHLRNPFPGETELTVTLVGPDGWKTGAAAVQIAGRGEGSVKVSIEPPLGTRCRRQPIAADVSGGGRRFGQAAETLVTIGYPVF